MAKAFSWWITPLKFRQIPLFILLMVILGLVWSDFAVTIAQDLHLPLANNQKTNETHIALVMVILMILAFCEELFFRVAPLFFALKKNISYRWLFLVVCISSIIFGWLHGPVTHVFVQGITGLIFATVYLKCGGLEKKFGRAFVCSVTAHFMFNAFIFGSIAVERQSLTIMFY